MKLRLPLTLAAAIMACYSHVSFSADTGTGFSINFIRNDTFSMGSTDPIQNVGMPGVEIPSGFWNNISPVTANAWYSVERDNQGGALTGISVATTRASFWSSGKTDTQTDKLLASYIDAGKADAYTVTIAGVPYLSSTVYIIMSGDSTQVEHNTAMNVNGVNWTFKDGEMVEGTDVWGSYANNQGALVLGTNVLEIKDITGGSIFISNVVNSAGRGCIAGIQVVDSYAGTYLYRTLGSTAAWTDALWSDTDGETGSLAWGGTNHAAVIKAEAGGSTLSVTGTVSADGIILKSGKLILSGGTLNMTGAAAFITEVGTTLKLDETSVTATGGLTFQGGGIFEVTNISKLPTLLKIDGGTLNSLNAVTVGEGGDMRVGGTAVFQAPSLTVESGGTISIHRSFSEALKVDSFSGSGELVLGTAISFDKDTLPGVHEFLKDFSGTLTLGGAGEYYFNYTGSTDFGSSILIGKEGMTIHVEKGATFRLNPINNGSNTFQNDMILEAGSSFYKQDSSLLNLAGNILMNGNVTDSIIITGQWGAKSTLFSGKISGQGTVQLRLSGGLTETFRINNAANDFSGTWMVGRNDGGEITLQLEADAISMASVEISNKGILRNNVESASLVNLSGTMADGQVTSGAADGSFNTLTVKGTANYAGKIGKNLNLNLAGGVAHVLSGDLSAFTGTIAVADNAASNLTLSGSSSADGVNLSMSQGNLTTGVKVNLLSADSSSLTLSLTAGGQIVVTGTASAFASTAVTGAGMIGMDLNSSTGTLDLGDFTIGATGGFLRINLSNTDDLSQFSLTATGTSLDVLRGSLTASAGNKLYVASGYAGNNVSFSEMNLLVNESESGADKYYYRNGDSVTLSQPEYSMNSLLINGDADETTTDEIILNGAALSADTLTFASSAAYTIKNGETARRRTTLPSWVGNADVEYGVHDREYYGIRFACSVSKCDHSVGNDNIGESEL